MWQYDGMRAVIQVVDVDDLRVCILNVRHGEAYSLHRLTRSDEAGHHNSKCKSHFKTDRLPSVISLGCISSRVS